MKLGRPLRETFADGEKAREGPETKKGLSTGGDWYPSRERVMAAETVKSPLPSIECGAPPPSSVTKKPRKISRSWAAAEISFQISSLGEGIKLEGEAAGPRGGGRGAGRGGLPGGGGG